MNLPVAADGRRRILLVLHRPLNKYVPSLKTFACPNDRGDAVFTGKTNCYGQYGNSYLTEWGIDAWRVRHVTGDPSQPAGSYAATPIKSGEVALGPATKIVQGDWAWHGNRGVTDPRSIWHNGRGQNRTLMLYGDGHAQAYRFPADMLSMNPPGPDCHLMWR